MYTEGENSAFGAMMMSPFGSGSLKSDTSDKGKQSVRPMHARAVAGYYTYRRRRVCGRASLVLVTQQLSRTPALLACSTSSTSKLPLQRGAPCRTHRSYTKKSDRGNKLDFLVCLYLENSVQWLRTTPPKGLIAVVEAQWSALRCPACCTLACCTAHHGELGRKGESVDSRRGGLTSVCPLAMFQSH